MWLKPMPVGRDARRDPVYAQHSPCGTALVWQEFSTPTPDDPQGTTMKMFCPTCQQVVLPGLDVSVSGPYVAFRG